MSLLQTYLASGELPGFLAAIAMPEEAATQIIRHAASSSFAAVEPYFEGLFSPSTGAAATKEIQAVCQESDGNFYELTVFLLAALHTKRLYAERSIPDTVYIDTFKVFSRFVREHQQSKGDYGFDRGFWMYRSLSCILFRLGILEYELYTCDGEVADKLGVAVGETAISIHIPSDCVISREGLQASYGFAEQFFATTFPEVKPSCYFCDSWLLSPALPGLLSLSSRILLFQSGFTILSVNPEDEGYMGWVFKRKYDSPSEFPETTSLQRSVKGFVLQGGRIGSAFGRLKPTEWAE